MRTLEDRGCLEQLQQRIGKLNPTSERHWGRMTAHQMVCHLADAYRVMMGFKPAESLENFAGRTIIRFIALHTPLPWPKGVKTTHACDAEKDMTRPVEFARDLAELQTLMRQFVTGKPAFLGARHPMMGQLSRWELMRWGYLHTDHHLRQFGL